MGDSLIGPAHPYHHQNPTTASPFLKITYTIDTGATANRKIISPTHLQQHYNELLGISHSPRRFYCHLVAGQQVFHCPKSAPYAHCGTNNYAAVPPTWDITNAAKNGNTYDCPGGDQITLCCHIGGEPGFPSKAEYDKWVKDHCN
ncbi:hypothetical protein KEM48_005121 [Puccinia striiformis f. sp. tritici PST-130]|nr:hypothetical protein KEM48_005121 [Puccinia striiformis f. sp. tritici PST-130]